MCKHKTMEKDSAAHVHLNVLDICDAYACIFTSTIWLLDLCAVGESKGGAKGVYTSVTWRGRVRPL